MFSKTTANKTIVTFEDVMTFGKYKGELIGDVYDVDASYLAWAIENTDKLIFSEEDKKMIFNKAEEEHSDWLHDALDDDYNGYNYD